MDMPIEFLQLKPITIQFDSETIREVMTTDEIRADLGLPDLTEQQEEQTFYHEFIHAALDSLGYPDLSSNEQLVDQIGSLIQQLMKSKK